MYLRLVLLLVLLPAFQAQDGEVETETSPFKEFWQSIKFKEIGAKLKKLGEDVRDKVLEVTSRLKDSFGVGVQQKATVAVKRLKGIVKEAFGVCTYNLERQFNRLVKELNFMFKSLKDEYNKEHNKELPEIMKDEFEKLKAMVQQESDIERIIEYLAKLFEHGLGVRDTLVDILKEEGLMCFKWLVKKTAKEISAGNLFDTNDIR